MFKGGKSFWLSNRAFLPNSFKIRKLDKNLNAIRKCVLYRLSTSSLKKTRLILNTQKVEGFNRSLHRSLPKNVTYTKNFEGRVLSAIHSVNLGPANEESDDDAEIENAIVEQPDVNAVTPTRVPLSPRILVTNILPLNTNVELPASRPVTARSESTAENISVHSVNNIKKRRRVTQEDVFQMQVKVCKEQMELYSEQRRLVKEQTEKEKKQSQKVALQIQLLRKLNEDDNIPPTLTDSQVAYLAAMSSCFEDS
ncbi:Hypothetical predicted protein [Mytilus galloprovincialis]|uniref:Uncharacterized protein n=1 Tax=Mytilus galloprovincialis TaxID=29158 RepID=A0A8B6BLM2_MYTGA|nr:Hypothetical predicted protein [Mytilus galloprovincialis]